MFPFINLKPMRRRTAPPAPRDHDLESQSHEPESHARHSTLGPNYSRSTGDSLPQHPYVEARAQNNHTKSEPEWKPWKFDDPYRTQVPQSDQAMEEWVKAMKESDDGMCQGWTDQIDTLIIFAGLFSATVTAFTIESYRWLDETQVDMVARLQLRALLIAAHDPAVDQLAPTTFQISPSSVLVNTLWFASLTLALGAVVVSILCKQWLYEYQRYENLTMKEIFLIRGLRYRGLKAWRVPEIIASLPTLLQIALVLFLVGLLVLLGPLQPVVAAVITAIVGLIFLFMGITTILPSVQYIYPRFDTQCAYKSSQSWSFFVLSAFWLFDFSMFTTWVAFDRWEVTCISGGMGLTLSRVYELLSNSVDAFQNIYAFLADVSLRPMIYADLSVLYDFIGGLDASRRDDIIEVTQQAMSIERHSKKYRRIEQIEGYIDQYYKTGPGRLKPALPAFEEFSDFESGFEKIKPDAPVIPTYYLQTQMILGEFLRNDIHFSTPAIINRYIEHWAKCIDNGNEGVENKKQQSAVDENKKWRGVYWAIERARQAGIQWNPEIGSHLVEMHSRLLKEEHILSEESIRHISIVYPSLLESYQHRSYNPPPFILLDNIQESINRIPETVLITKINRAQHVLYRMVHKSGIFKERPDIHVHEKQLSFAQFLLNFFDETNISVEQRASFWAAKDADQAITVLRNYLDQSTRSTPPSSAVQVTGNVGLSSQVGPVAQP